MKFWTNYIVSPKTNEHKCPRVNRTEFFHINLANVMFAMPTEGLKRKHYEGKEKPAK